MNKFYVAETCNRGPLLFVGRRLKALNYLDEDNFVLGDDDHDVMARAYDMVLNGTELGGGSIRIGNREMQMAILLQKV